MQQVFAKSCEISLESVCRELDEAISVARAKGQAAPLVNAASLRARLGGLLVDKAQIEVSSANQFDECETVEAMADRMLGELTNARWLPITDADKHKLADILHRSFAEAQAFLDSVRARPLMKDAISPADRHRSHHRIGELLREIKLRKGRHDGKGRKERSHGAVVKLADLSAGHVLCAIRVTCAGPGSPADRSAAQAFQSEHVPLEAWPQGGARSRPRRQCSRDLQSFSGAPRSSRAWSCR